jgi:hypothetical protein
VAIMGERLYRTSATIGLGPFSAFSLVPDQSRYQAGTNRLAPNGRKLPCLDTAPKD